MTGIAPATTALERVPRLVGVAWAFLLVNTLGYTDASTLIPFPKSVSQIVTMGALCVAFGLALLANPRFRIRPNAYLLGLSLLVVVAVAGSARMDSGYGALLRCARLAVFVATLWLLSCWWRGDMRFARFQLLGFSAISLSVAVGMVVNPGGAFSGADGRLTGTLWPIPAPQVALYSAVAAGLAIIMWVTRVIDGRSATVIAVPAVLLLILSHTRTALFGLVAGLVVSGLVLSVTHPRARRVVVAAAGLAFVGWVLFGSMIAEWLTRGQSSELLSNFTGRAKVWDQLLAQNRTLAELIFGVGLTDKSFNGLPIDNAWYSIYLDEGWAGVALVAFFLLALLCAALLRRQTPERACALFLIVYCLATSYTEVGLGDASPYLINLAVAASLLVMPGRSVAARTPRRPEAATATPSSSTLSSSTPSTSAPAAVDTVL